MVVATRIHITRKDLGIELVTGELYGEVDDSGSTADTSTIVLTLSRDYLTAEDDAVLAELWDNEQDAVYDNL